MKLTSIFRSGLAVTALAVLITGCGGEKSEKTAANKKESGEPSAKEPSSSESKGEEKKPAANAKPVKVISNLPHKDLDPMSTDKGIEPGRLLIDAKGQDSNGKPMKLSDYKGKVMLIDVWASW